MQSLDEAHSSPGLHAAAGPELAEECATLVRHFLGCCSRGAFGFGIVITVCFVSVFLDICRVGAGLGWRR